MSRRETMRWDAAGFHVLALAPWPSFTDRRIVRASAEPFRAERQ